MSIKNLIIGMALAGLTMSALADTSKVGVATHPQTLCPSNASPSNPICLLEAGADGVSNFGTSLDSLCIKGYPKKSSSLSVVLCNLGGYTIRKSVLYIYDKEGNELSRSIDKGDLTLGWSANFWMDARSYARAAGNPNYAKVKLKYWIAGGDTKSCTFTFNPASRRNVWLVHTRGTTLNNNRCRKSNRNYAY